MWSSGGTRLKTGQPRWTRAQTARKGGGEETGKGLDVWASYRVGGHAGDAGLTHLAHGRHHGRWEGCRLHADDGLYRLACLGLIREQRPVCRWRDALGPNGVHQLSTCLGADVLCWIEDGSGAVWERCGGAPNSLAGARRRLSAVGRCLGGRLRVANTHVRVANTRRVDTPCLCHCRPANFQRCDHDLPLLYCCPHPATRGAPCCLAGRDFCQPGGSGLEQREPCSPCTQCLGGLLLKRRACVSTRERAAANQRPAHAKLSIGVALDSDTLDSDAPTFHCIPFRRPTSLLSGAAPRARHLPTPSAISHLALRSRPRYTCRIT